MKKFSMGLPFGSLVLLSAMSGFSQPQLFEQGQGGIVLFTGTKWNSKITQPILGFEYNIEGRTSLGLKAAKPLKDTLTFDPDLKAYSFNPYIEFELIEPGNLTILSFSMRGDIVLEDATRPDSTQPDVTGLKHPNFNGYGRTSYGGGPVFSVRFQTNEKVTVVPMASYELFYVNWHRNWPFAPKIDGSTGLPVVPAQTEPLHLKDSYIWHDITAGVITTYRFTEKHGITFAPKFVAKIGTGLAKDDLINIDISLGYSLTF